MKCASARPQPAGRCLLFNIEGFCPAVESRAVDPRPLWSGMIPPRPLPTTSRPGADVGLNAVLSHGDDKWQSLRELGAAENRPVRLAGYLGGLTAPPAPSPLQIKTSTDGHWHFAERPAGSPSNSCPDAFLRFDTLCALKQKKKKTVLFHSDLLRMRDAV